MSEEKYIPLNFIEEIIEEDLSTGKHAGRIHTRFPPEPNGYLHIGHAKAICTNFELAKKYGGKTNLRFDDTNPTTEETKYVEAIQRDIKWLGYEWEGEPLFASDYFEDLYKYATQLIESGDAYIDESTAEEIAEQKGVPTSPGKESPFRNRSIEDSLRLFKEMKEGKHPDGSMVLRVKVDMTAPNMHLRDPVIYRVKHQHHHRTGDDWCIYPMYDFAHGQSDSMEKITHSLCSLEFIHHRPLYNWFIEKLGIFPSRQIEFARMNVAYMITSKRRLLRLVQEGIVGDWDDPRMPTISGLRRLGYPAKAFRVFCDKVGLAKRDNLIEIELLESCVREELNKVSTRLMVVLEPLKLTIINYPDGQVEMVDVDNNPEQDDTGKRKVPFSKHLYIEQGDFMVDAPKKFFRLGPEKTVRLKNGYIISHRDHTVDADGNVTEVFVEYYPESKSGSDTSGIKAKGVLHWVSVEQAVSIDTVNYDRLFTDPTPLGHEGKDMMDFVNKDSKHVDSKALAEPHILEVGDSEHLQFMRKGYYIKDQSSTTEKLVFNKTISLKDSWGKSQKKKN